MAPPKTGQEFVSDQEVMQHMAELTQYPDYYEEMLKDYNKFYKEAEKQYKKDHPKADLSKHVNDIQKDARSALNKEYNKVINDDNSNSTGKNRHWAHDMKEGLQEATNIRSRSETPYFESGEVVNESKSPSPIVAPTHTNQVYDQLITYKAEKALLELKAKMPEKILDNAIETARGFSNLASELDEYLAAEELAKTGERDKIRTLTARETEIIQKQTDIKNLDAKITEIKENGASNAIAKFKKEIETYEKLTTEETPGDNQKKIETLKAEILKAEEKLPAEEKALAELEERKSNAVNNVLPELQNLNKEIADLSGQLADKYPIVKEVNEKIKVLKTRINEINEETQKIVKGDADPLVKEDELDPLNAERIAAYEEIKELRSNKEYLTANKEFQEQEAKLDKLNAKKTELEKDIEKNGNKIGKIDKEIAELGYELSSAREQAEDKLPKGVTFEQALEGRRRALAAQHDAMLGAYHELEYAKDHLETKEGKKIVATYVAGSTGMSTEELKTAIGIQQGEYTAQLSDARFGEASRDLRLAGDKKDHAILNSKTSNPEEKADAAERIEAARVDIMKEKVSDWKDRKIDNIKRDHAEEIARTIQKLDKQLDGINQSKRPNEHRIISDQIEALKGSLAELGYDTQKEVDALHERIKNEDDAKKSNKGFKGFLTRAFDSLQNIPGLEGIMPFITMIAGMFGIDLEQKDINTSPEHVRELVAHVPLITEMEKAHLEETNRLELTGQDKGVVQYLRGTKEEALYNKLHKNNGAADADVEAIMTNLNNHPQLHIALGHYQSEMTKIGAQEVKFLDAANSINLGDYKIADPDSRAKAIKSVEEFINKNPDHENIEIIKETKKTLDEIDKGMKESEAKIPYLEREVINQAGKVTGPIKKRAEDNDKNNNPTIPEKSLTTALTNLSNELKSGRGSIMSKLSRKTNISDPKNLIDMEQMKEVKQRFDTHDTKGPLATEQTADKETTPPAGKETTPPAAEPKYIPTAQLAAITNAATMGYEVSGIKIGGTDHDFFAKSGLDKEKLTEIGNAVDAKSYDTAFESKYGIDKKEFDALVAIDNNDTLEAAKLLVELKKDGITWDDEKLKDAQGADIPSITMNNKPLEVEAALN